MLLIFRITTHSVIQQPRRRLFQSKHGQQTTPARLVVSCDDDREMTPRAHVFNAKDGKFERLKIAEN